jgi:hypothetical protein
MYYHSPQFQNIADQAAADARPLILQTIRDLVPDFIKQFPEFTRIDCSTGKILWHYEIAEPCKTTFVVTYTHRDEYGEMVKTVVYAGNDEAAAAKCADESDSMSAEIEIQEWINAENTRNEYC